MDKPGWNSNSNLALIITGSGHRTAQSWDLSAVSAPRLIVTTDGNPSGVNYEYFHGSYSQLPNFTALAPVQTGTMTNFSLYPRLQNDNFAFKYEACLSVPTAGNYSFYTSSDDGSKLYIGTTAVVNNDGLHGTIESSGAISLTAGVHPIEVQFFEAGGGEVLSVQYAGPGIVKQPIPNSALSTTGCGLFAMNNAYSSSNTLAQSKTNYFLGGLASLIPVGIADAQAAPTPEVSMFSYDLLGQITHAQYPDTNTYDYSYNPVSSRLQQTKNTDTTDYTYNADDELTNSTDETFAYDANGNATSIASDSRYGSLAYDEENRLVKFDGALTPTPIELQFTPVVESVDDINIGSNAKPAFLDYDGDGDKDMFIGKAEGDVDYFRNAGLLDNNGIVTPVFSTVTTSTFAFDVGVNSAPTFVDINGDGVEELMVGEAGGNINHYVKHDIGTLPSYNVIVEDFAGIQVGAESAPAFIDIDADGDYDLFVGEAGGTLFYYENTGSSTTPSFTLISNSYAGIDVGTNSTPHFYDYESDGDYDLFVGNSDGTIYFYRNNGTSTAASFVLENANVDGIDIGGGSAPVIVNMDGDEYDDMLIGENAGSVNLYKGTPKPPAVDPITDYIYDGAGNRIAKSNGGSQTRYVNDVSGELPYVLAETNAANQIQNYYIYGAGLQSQGGAGSNTRSYPLTDGMGNVRFVADGTGTKTAEYHYDPFGNIRSTEGIGVDVQFATEHMDPESAFIFLRARHYDPVTGRFLSRDPFAGYKTNPLTRTPYIYALNNPMIYSDPSGESVALVGLAVVGCGVVAAEGYELVNASREYNQQKDTTLSEYETFPEYWADVRDERLQNNPIVQVGLEATAYFVGQDSYTLGTILEAANIGIDIVSNK